MSDEVALHNALREFGYLPASVDLKFSQCPTKHVELMESMAEGLGVGSSLREAELRAQLEAEENKHRDTARELHATEQQLERLEVDYRRALAELEKIKKGAR